MAAAPVSRLGSGNIAIIEAMKEVTQSDQPDKTQPDETQPDETQPDKTQPDQGQQAETRAKRASASVQDIQSTTTASQVIVSSVMPTAHADDTADDTVDDVVDGTADEVADEVADGAATRVGVALGGGSARGYAHIGALISLERHGLTPSVIVGTSFGAIIGSMYASGYSLHELRHFATNQRRRDLIPQLIDFGLHKAALFRGDKLETYFERLLEGRHFADLEHNFAIVATDVDTGERVLLREGSIAKALRASASMPGIFAPVEIDGRRLMDGGIGTPVPLDTLEHFATDLAIGIEVGIQCEDSASIQFAQRCLSTPWGNRVHVGLRDTTGGHPVLVFGRTLAHTFTSWQTVPDLPAGALNIHTKPPINWLNFHRAEEAILAGEQALESYMPTIKNALATQ